MASIRWRFGCQTVWRRGWWALRFPLRSCSRTTQSCVRFGRLRPRCCGPTAAVVWRPPGRPCATWSGLPCTHRRVWPCPLQALVSRVHRSVQVSRCQTCCGPASRPRLSLSVNWPSFATTPCWFRFCSRRPVWSLSEDCRAAVLNPSHSLWVRPCRSFHRHTRKFCQTSSVGWQWFPSALVTLCNINLYCKN